ADAELDEPIGDFLDRHRFGAGFRDGYFLPMIGCIWSCPTDQMLRFPVGTMIRFCHNHGLIQVSDRPQWHTVRGGSREYVRRIVAGLDDARLATPVRQVRRLPPGHGGAGVMVVTDAGEERFDEVVLACHSDQSLALLADAAPDERALLGAIRYQPNRAVLHTDAGVMPRSRRAWAAWNYERAADASSEQASVCLHYWINRLQPLPWSTPVVVSLNPVRPIDPARVIAEFDYAHPVFDLGAIDAQRRLPGIQGRSHVWFCGAWTRYGFHEDGLASALAVVDAMRARWAARDAELVEAA
ncbi:MAG TPA: NAD/FAD-binding protein, partial [Rubrivivax sp.]|nr:NAD/FAD-binding protein [Rubrivivax sp.]